MVCGALPFRSHLIHKENKNTSGIMSTSCKAREQAQSQWVHALKINSK